MIGPMAEVRMSEAEVIRDIAAVLEKVRQGLKVVIEQDRRVVATITPGRRPGRKISDCIALAKAFEEKLGYAPVPDADFAKDVQAAIDSHPEPLKPPSGD